MSSSTETAPPPPAPSEPELKPVQTEAPANGETATAAPETTAAPAAPVPAETATTEPEQPAATTTAAPTEPTKTDDVPAPTPTVAAAAAAADDTTKTDDVAKPAPATEEETDGWPALAPSHPLVALLKRLPEIKKAAGHDEVWNVTLSDPPASFTTLTSEDATATATKTEETKKIPSSSLLPIPQMNILQKFLRANKNDLEKAVKQLQDTLAWRKDFQPRKAAFEEKYDGKLFGGLGYITEVTVEGKKTVVVWNIYGAVEDKKKTFGDLDTFMKWRVGLMEASLEPLNFPTTTTIIPDYDPNTPTTDPFQAIQVHDYLNISFLRQDPSVKAASKKIIETMSNYYPELLSRKFFVNVPVLMQWVFNTVKLLLPKETVAKFSIISYGEQLHKELGEDVPKEYGGKREALKEWKGADYTVARAKEEVVEEPTKTTATDEPATEEKKVEVPKVEEPKVETAEKVDVAKAEEAAAAPKPAEDEIKPVEDKIEELNIDEKKPETAAATSSTPAEVKAD